MLRLLSALGIFWFHTQVAGAEVGYGGLVFYGAINLAAGAPLGFLCQRFRFQVVVGDRQSSLVSAVRIRDLGVAGSFAGLSEQRKLRNCMWSASHSFVGYCRVVAGAKLLFGLSVGYLCARHACGFLGHFRLGGQSIRQPLRWSIFVMTVIACVTTISIPDQGLPY
ncbi:MAG: hypothetical protein GY747_12250 [Planctomycetes bacterium]|nr:hypothetical protein [Planctomycetota bacterium]MCP4771764.1 hypothetical protein [Planctomycetota bacterium]MCP4860993.1 hypothetical protein [Planctomycetota bacterium]